MNQLGQRPSIKFLWKEGCLAKDIHHRLQAVYCHAAHALPGVYFWIKEFQCGREGVVDQPRSRRPAIDNLDADIVCVVQHSQFGTLRSIADEVSVSPETVRRRLTE
jgi:hypothetical protein